MGEEWRAAVVAPGVQVHDLVGLRHQPGVVGRDQHGAAGTGQLEQLVRDQVVALDDALAAASNPHDLTVELRRLGLVP